MPIDDPKFDGIRSDVEFVQDALIWAGEMELSFREDGTEVYRYIKDEPPTLERWKDALHRYYEFKGILIL